MHMVAGLCKSIEAANAIRNLDVKRSSSKLIRSIFPDRDSAGVAD